MNQKKLITGLVNRKMSFTFAPQSNKEKFEMVGKVSPIGAK
jgi:hypothetical protein